MTEATKTKETKTFVVRYAITDYVAVEVERDADISEEALLKSISKDDLVSGEHQTDGAWDSLKDAWRSQDAEVFVYDEDDCYEEAEFAS